VINNYTVTIISAQNTININPEAEIRKEMAGKELAFPQVLATPVTHAVPHS